MKTFKKLFVILFIIISVYSMIINLTILFLLLTDKKEEVANEELPNKIFLPYDIEDEIIEEYDFAQEGMRI